MSIESVMLASLRRIFKLSKVTFDKPGESQEQECLFIQVDQAKGRIKDKVETSRVQGKLTIFASLEKMPLGYMAKCISAAQAADTKPFFFFDLEENAGTIGNISERTASFLFLYKGQYDPDVGTLNQLNIESD